jgi:signal transduction histidine kinase/CheY-like chemotaxis protein
MKVELSDALGIAAARWFEELDDRGVFITNEHLVVRRWNHWLAAQTGRTAADTVGQSLFEIYPALVERGVDGYYRDALAGEVRILSERFHKFLLPITRNFHGAGLTEMSQSARIEPLRDGGTVIGTITLIEDVTERVIAERELRTQIAASETARRLAENASRLKDEFLATLSHEIRTPLNAVIGWTRILQTQPSVRSRAHALDVIERNAMAQLRLVEDLLDMARIISGKLRLNMEPVALADVAQAAVEVVAPGAAAKGIGIETVWPDDLPAVSGDSERLQQVVWNLLSNALKFTEAGGHVRLEIARSREPALSVRDNGQGVPAEFVPYVFDRFRQADASASRRQGGLGLGLSLVRQIVELHGGTVGVESAGEKQGSTFWVTLPADLEGGVRPSGQASAYAPITLAGVAILIVDDESDAREMLVAMLENFGAVVQTAATADEALDLLTSGALRARRADLGRRHGRDDGFALIREIRGLESPKTRSLPAIAVTAYANPEDRVEALVAGYQNHIPKAGRSAGTRGGHRPAARRVAPGGTRGAWDAVTAVWGCPRRLFRLGLGLPVLKRLRTGLDAFEIGIDAAGSPGVLAFCAATSCRLACFSFCRSWRWRSRWRFCCEGLDLFTL